MYTSLPVFTTYPDSPCTALYAGGFKVDVGSGNGYPDFLSRKVVDNLYVVDDTVQFVYSIGDPTRRLYPDGAADD